MTAHLHDMARLSDSPYHFLLMGAQGDNRIEFVGAYAEESDSWLDSLFMPGAPECEG